MSNKVKIIIGTCLTLGVAIIIGTIIAINNKTYTVTFDSNGGSFVPLLVVKTGKTVSKPDNPTRDGYEFVSWNYNNSEFDFSTIIKEDMTLKAVWKEIAKEVIKYTVTFTVDGKTKTQEVESGSLIDLDSFEFAEKDGYELVWYLDGKVYDMNTPLTGNVSIEGKYEKLTSYVVKFNTDGGSKVSDQKVKKDEKAKEPTEPTKEGYLFDGWYLNSKKYDFDTVVTKSITLKAKWDEDPSVTRYTVTFDSTGGTSVSKQRIIENKQATKPKNPTKSGYSFVEWQLDDKAYDFKTKVTSDIKLVAVWKELEKYTVIFDSSEGTSVASQTITEGNKATKPKDPTRSGYSFVEWQLSGKKYDFNSKVTSNITLKAVWKEEIKNYTISVKRADNFSPDSILKVYEDGKEISVKEIKYTDGTKLCKGSNLTVNTNDIAGEKSFIVVLNNGKEVKAIVK